MIGVSLLAALVILPTQIEVDEPEDDSMALLMGAEQDKPVEDDMSEEKLLRALMEAQGEG